MKLELQFSGTLVSHKWLILEKDEIKKRLKRCKMCQKAKNNGQFVMNCPNLAEVEEFICFFNARKAF